MTWKLITDAFLLNVKLSNRKQIDIVKDDWIPIAILHSDALDELSYGGCEEEIERRREIWQKKGSWECIMLIEEFNTEDRESRLNDSTVLGIYLTFLEAKRALSGTEVGSQHHPLPEIQNANLPGYLLFLEHLVQIRVAVLQKNCVCFHVRDLSQFPVLAAPGFGPIVPKPQACEGETQATKNDGIECGDDSANEKAPGNIHSKEETVPVEDELVTLPLYETIASRSNVAFGEERVFAVLEDLRYLAARFEWLLPKEVLLGVREKQGELERGPVKRSVVSEFAGEIVSVLNLAKDKAQSKLNSEPEVEAREVSADMETPGASADETKPVASAEDDPWQEFRELVKDSKAKNLDWLLFRALEFGNSYIGKSTLDEECLEKFTDQVIVKLINGIAEVDLSEELVGRIRKIGAPENFGGEHHQSRTSKDLVAWFHIELVRTKCVYWPFIAAFEERFIGFKAKGETQRDGRGIRKAITRRRESHDFDLPNLEDKRNLLGKNEFEKIFGTSETDSE